MRSTYHLRGKDCQRLQLLSKDRHRQVGREGQEGRGHQEGGKTRMEEGPGWRRDQDGIQSREAFRVAT